MYKLLELGPLLSFIAEGFILFDEEGTITVINPHASLLLDYTSGELVGEQIDEAFEIYLDDELLAKDKRITNEVFRAGKPFVVPSGHTMYFGSKSGRKFPVFASAKAMKFKGENMGVLVFRDITTEKALENYKKNTADILSRLTPVWQRTATGDFSGKVLMPEREDEFTELMVGVSLMMEDLRELEQTRKKSEEEKHKLAEEYSKELEKKVTEKTSELSKTKLHIETIIENLPDGLIEYDSDFTVLRINRAAEKMLGVGSVGVVGKQIKPADIEKIELESLVKVSYPELATEGRKIPKEISGLSSAEVQEILIKYPIELEVQVVTAPVINPATSEKYGLVKVIRDVTREKMISKNKSEFISIAAHQLRTPLSSVKWVMKLVIDGDMGPLNDEQLQYLNRGYETNQKMIGLVNDLLSVARIEGGRFGYSFKESDIRETIEVALRTSRFVAKERGVEILFQDNTKGIEPFVFDSEKISLAIQNLLDNAIKYSNFEGRVVFEVEKEGDYLKFKISDHGVGIPKVQIGRIFSKFFRAENVIHMQTVGSGLGLFIVKNIISRHGGDIFVESEEGKGTTFTFTLPVKEDLIPKEEKLFY